MSVLGTFQTQYDHLKILATNPLNHISQPHVYIIPRLQVDTIVHQPPAFSIWNQMCHPHDRPYICDPDTPHCGSVDSPLHADKCITNIGISTLHWLEHLHNCNPIPIVLTPAMFKQTSKKGGKSSIEIPHFFNVFPNIYPHRVIPSGLSAKTI